MRFLSHFALLVAAAGPLGAQTAPDRAVLAFIQREATERSRVMDHAAVLADVHGARLTGAPAFRAAGEWAAGRLREMGLATVRREPLAWDRGWASTRVAVRLLAPENAPLLAAAGPWSIGTRGPVSGSPILAPAPTDVTADGYARYVAAWRGKLRGKVVLMSPPRAVPPGGAPPPLRPTDEELDRLARTPPAPAGPAFPPALADTFRLWGKRLGRFLADEGVVALAHQSRGDGGMVVSFGPDWARDADAVLPPTVFLAAEHYARVVRLLERGVPVRLSVDLATTFFHDPAAAFNLTAELPGRDRGAGLVMVGAHLDSWTGGGGATDDAAGCAIALEALRILAALGDSSGMRPARAVRLALWGGHEGAGVGSVAYVREHFGSAEAPGPERARLSAYLNLDNGGGRVRGVYLPRREERLRPMLEAWLAPRAEEGLGARWVLPVGEPDGSDHVSFHRAGLPGFMLVQDPLDYRTLTRHSNLDVYDRLRPNGRRRRWWRGCSGARRRRPSG